MPINIPSGLRPLLWLLTVAAVMWLLIAYLHGAPRPPGPHGFPESQRRRTPEQRAEGKVIGYAGDASGDADRLSLLVGGDSLWLHFPPHAARQVMNLARKNSLVTVRYDESGPPHRETSFELISVQAAGRQDLLDLRAVPPPPPRPGARVIITGGKKDLVFPTIPQARFFVLSGKRIVLSPRSAETVFPLLKNGEEISVTGDARSDTEGFVSLDGLPLVRAATIKIDTINYLVE